jgi:hypothetical protein
MLRDPGPGLRAVHERRQHLREQGEQPLVIDPPDSQCVVERAVFLLWMRDNTQREGNGRLAHGNQIYERIMPANSDICGLQVKS